MSSGEIARRLGVVADRVVRYRIRRLLDRDVVLLQAMVRPSRVGYPIIADILIEVAPWKLAETCARLTAMPTVASAGASYAGRQVSIQVNARDERELAAFVQTTLPQIDGILSARAAVVPYLIKDLAYWLPPALKMPEGQAHLSAGPAAPVRRDRSPQPEATLVLDDLDREIIRFCQEDPRMSSRDMKHRLGDVSDRVVRYRVRRLLDARVLLVQARVNPHSVGYSVVADTLVEVKPWKFAEACAALAAMEPVCYVSAARAASDRCQLSIETNSRTEDELAAFVRTKLRRIDGIVGAQTMVVPHLVKDVATWTIPRSL